MIAAFRGYAELIPALVGAGGDVDATVRDGLAGNASALTLALSGWEERWHLHGAPPHRAGLAAQASELFGVAGSGAAASGDLRGAARAMLDQLAGPFSGGAWPADHLRPPLRIAAEGRTAAAVGALLRRGAPLGALSPHDLIPTMTWRARCCSMLLKQAARRRGAPYHDGLRELGLAIPPGGMSRSGRTCLPGLWAAIDALHAALLDAALDASA
eukprot:gene7480-11346_t